MPAWCDIAKPPAASSAQQVMRNSPQAALQGARIVAERVFSGEKGAEDSRDHWPAFQLRALGGMNKLVLSFSIFALAACQHVSAEQAKQIAYERLSAATDGPSLQGKALESGLTVSESSGGRYLIELRDEKRKFLWAVIVKPSGASEISRMAIDG